MPILIPVLVPLMGMIGILRMGHVCMWGIRTLVRHAGEIVMPCLGTAPTNG